MKSEKLLDAIGSIDNNLVYHAVNDTRQKKKSNRFKWGQLLLALPSY